MAATTLSQISQIMPGHPFRSRIDDEPGGGFIVVQPRDLGGNGRVNLSNAVRFHAPPGSAPVHLRALDIVLQPRGTRFSAAIFSGAELPTVAAAPLLIVRVDPARAVPEYVLAVLASPATQSLLRQSAVGTYVLQVSRQAIEDLAIELPDLSTQARLADLAALGRRERELMDRLRDARARFYELAVVEVAKKARKRANAPGPKPASLAQERP
jgi:hypothetical protein